MRFLSTLMVAFAARHFAFHCLRLWSNKRISLYCGLLYGSSCGGLVSLRLACNPFSLLRMIIGHLCLQHKIGTIFQGKHLPQYQRPFISLARGCPSAESDTTWTSQRLEPAVLSRPGRGHTRVSRAWCLRVPL